MRDKPSDMNQEEQTNHESREETHAVSRILKTGAVVAVWLACLTWYAAQPSPEHVETLYSRGVYRVLAAWVTPITAAVPFSIAFVLLIGGPVLFLALWTANWVYRRRARRLSHWRGFIWGPKWLAVLVPIVWLWFLVFWGIGYGRLPVETRLHFDDKTVSEAELIQIKSALLETILRDQPRRTEDRNAGRAIESVSRTMQALVAKWEGGTMRLPHRVKATPAGFLLMNGTSGVCAPFTLEPHVDGGLPDTAFVSVAAHELGHIAGVCDEGETNLLGYMAGLSADDPYARYAVALDVYVDVVRQFEPEIRKADLEKLPEQARHDLQRAREAHERFRIDWFQKWSWRAYNHYLKSQGVQEGVRSYGRGTQLLVKAWRAGCFTFPEAEPPAGENPSADTAEPDIQES